MRRLTLQVTKRLSSSTFTFSSTPPSITLSHSMSSTSMSSSPSSMKSIPSLPTSEAFAVEDDTVQLTGQGLVPVTTTLTIVDTAALPKWPVYRVMGKNGKLLLQDTEELPVELDEAAIVGMYGTMVRVQALDEIFYNAQRQGRMSFYMTSTGEEALQVGTSSALKKEDVILAQYREVGVLLFRGFSLQQVADQCVCNEGDVGKGRMMPVHYGSKEHNFFTISSPLATQLPQAVGCAYALKLSNTPAVSVCYFGEGAASEGDFHAAMNFATTLDAPMLFICRNNGYAISTPVSDQFRGDGIVSRAAGYGMRGIRVDGNDVFAVHLATRAARALALEHSCPVLIELMSYRRGHHSTSDDSTRYRPAADIKYWHDHLDPVARLRSFLEDRGWWSAEREQELRDTERLAVLQALERAEKKGRPNIDGLFEDVYAQMPWHLVKQREELREHMEKYPDPSN